MSLVAPFHGRRRTRGPHAGRGAGPRRARPVLLIGAGAGTAALVPVLRDLPEGTDLVVVLRRATREDRVHGAELAELTLRRGGRLVELGGARSALALDGPRLQALVADAASREVHAVGPAGFTEAALAAATAAGVPAARRHAVT